MIKGKDIKKNLSQIIALTEKNVKLRLRWKSSVVLNIGKPLIAVLMPLIVLNQLFSYNESFGPWTSETF